MGGITCGEDALSSQAAAEDLPPNEPRNENGTRFFIACLSLKHRGALTVPSLAMVATSIDCSVYPTRQSSPGVTESTFGRPRQTSQSSHRDLSDVRVDSEVAPITSSLPKPVSWILKRFKLKKEEEKSFHAAIATLELQAESTDMSVTEAETIVEELDEVQVLLTIHWHGLKFPIPSSR